MSDEATPLVIEIAKGFVSLLRQTEPKWQKAYLRFVSDESGAEAKASFVHTDGVEIINVLNHKTFFHAVTTKGRELLAALGKDRGLFLLVTDASLNYEIRFEYQDMDKWRISKLSGGTGLPEGIEG